MLFEPVVQKIGGAFRVSFGPLSSVFLAHTTSMNSESAEK